MLENAVFLLKSRVGLPVTEIALLSGYSPSNFASAFKDHFSYSFGAKDRGTIEKLLSIAAKTAAVIGAVAFVTVLTASEGIAGLFTGYGSGIAEIAGTGMKIFAFAFLLNGYNMIASSYFTSLGDARTSLVISALRSLLLISAFILILPQMLGDTGIWLSVPLAEAARFAVSLLCISRSGSKLQFNEQMPS